MPDRPPSEPSPRSPAGSLRCSALTRAESVDPVGTAGTYSGYLLVEWPLPWPRDIGDVRELAELREVLDAAGIRLQALVPLDGGSSGHRVVLYRQAADEPFAAYGRIERVAPAGHVVETALAMVHASEPETGRVRADVAADVLICTHGQRDVCCGSMGTTLAMGVLADHASFGAGVRIWRTSHTGGHRFAPTAVVLPHGTVWAYLDADALRRIVAGTGPLDDLLPRYRGCTGVGPARVQALEREAFARVGWPWLDHRRRGRVLPNGRVRLEAVAPDGSDHVWEATVEVARTVGVPDCGRPLSEAGKTASEWRVADVVGPTLQRPD